MSCPNANKGIQASPCTRLFAVCGNEITNEADIRPAALPLSQGTLLMDDDLPM